MLRDYQRDAHDAAVKWMKASTEPALIEAATGAGKSHIIAAIADTIRGVSGKKILSLQPNAELCRQNYEKYRQTGGEASIFSASAGIKCLRHPVVFATPGTVKNKITRFCDKFALVIIDEADGLTPTIKSIVETMRESNEYLRVLGLTATPYRMGSGYIYASREDGTPVHEKETKSPYFSRKIYTVTARKLIDEGYLTRPTIGETGGDHYNTSGMKLNARGAFDSRDIDVAYHGHGRKTSAIVSDVIARSKDRCGIMFFAATIQHAHEIMASLPPGLSAVVTSETRVAERRRTVLKFKAKKIKYLVNVAIYTRGFDATHVDVIAMLRATESVGLMQQIIGRGLRVDDRKKDLLILDYAQNIERHCPDGDIFSPSVSVAHRSDDAASISVMCPLCSTQQEFSARENKSGFNVSSTGYFTDLDGNDINTEYGALPAHYGRRCRASALTRRGNLEQCGYRWTYKECAQCGVDNDITARRCHSCRAEIVDPNEKLKIDFVKLKHDATRLQTDAVVEMSVVETLSRAGNECVRVDFTTPYRNFSVWLMPAGKSQKSIRAAEMFFNATNHGQTPPVSVTYKKDADTNFYTIYAYNQAVDEDKSV